MPSPTAPRRWGRRPKTDPTELRGGEGAKEPRWLRRCLGLEGKVPLGPRRGPCHERVRAQPPRPAAPPDPEGTPLSPPRPHSPEDAPQLRGQPCPHGGSTGRCQPPRGPASVPPLPEGMRHGEAPLQADALVHQELPEEHGRIAGGSAGGRGRRSPRRAGRAGQHGPVRDPRAGGEAPAPPVRSRKRAAVPAPAAPGKFPSPSRPAPGKLNNCLAPAAGAGSRSPPGVPGGPGTWPLAGPVPPATLLSPRRQLLPKGQGCSAWGQGTTPREAPGEPEQAGHGDTEGHG